MRSAAASARTLRVSLALLAACAPSAFDDLPGRMERDDPSLGCGGDDELCPSEDELDAASEPELDADGEVEPEPEPGSEPEPDPETDACTSCSEGDAQPELDAETCSSCAEPPDAAQCIDDAGAMCGPDAGACGGAAPACSPGQRQSEQRACGACNTGQQTRTRSCAADGCSWGAWSAWSGCGGVTAACTPNQTTSCANGDECGHRVCSSSCSWGPCVPRIANGCLRIREGHTDQGSNYRCCGGGGHWQFCLPDCRWSNDCVACTEGAPNFCTECY